MEKQRLQQQVLRTRSVVQIIKKNEVTVNLKKNAIQIVAKNMQCDCKYGAILQFSNFSAKVRTTFGTLQNIYEQIESIMKQESSSKNSKQKQEPKEQRIIISKEGNFTFLYGVLIKNKIQFRQQIIYTKHIPNPPNAQSLQIEINQLKKQNKQLLNRLQMIQKVLQIKSVKNSQNQQVQIKSGKLQNIQKIEQTLRSQITKQTDKIEEIKKNQAKQKEQSINFSNQMTELISLVQKNFRYQICKQLIEKNLLSSNQYFDTAHPNYGKFRLSNNNTISLNAKDNKWYHIMSPKKIKDKQFTTFSFKLIKSEYNQVIYGIGSILLKTSNQKVDQQETRFFIGHDGSSNGYVYQEKGKPIQVQVGFVKPGDIVKIEIYLNKRLVIWYKNGSQKLFTRQISEQFAASCLYPTVIMLRNQDTVQLSYQ